MLSKQTSSGAFHAQKVENIGNKKMGDGKKALALAFSNYDLPTQFLGKGLEKQLANKYGITHFLSLRGYTGIHVFKLTPWPNPKVFYPLHCFQQKECNG